MILESWDARCPGEGWCWLHPTWRQVHCPAVYSVGLSCKGLLALQNFEHCSTNADGQGVTRLPSVPACAPDGLPCFGRTSPFLALVYDRMNYHPLTGLFGLLRELSPDLPTLSVPLCYSVPCRRQYSVLGWGRPGFKSAFCLLLGKNNSTSLGLRLLSQVGNSDVRGAGKTK